MTDAPRSTNPLRDPQDRRLPRIAGPCGMVLFGVTGDLSRKKVMPAIYDLANRGLLPPGFSLVGFARRDWADQDFAQIVHDSVKEHARTAFREEVWKQLAEGFRFVPGDFDDDVAFDKLAADDRGARRVARHGRQPRVLPLDPARVLRRRRRPAQGARPRRRRRPRARWRRVVVEKPFGHDLESARELNGVLDGVFPPESVFRIDHYLGKETVQNILAMRFANNLFEPIWNSNYVDHVQITMAEDIGIGGRAGYYDGIGAARDVIQNHLLQLMALVAMEEPISFDAASLRTEKQKVLASARAPPAARPAPPPAGSTPPAGPAARRSSATSTRRTSHRPRRPRRSPRSRLDIDTRRWAGVPFYLRTGKRLGRRVTEVAVVVQAAPHLPFNATPTEDLGHNALVIRVQPDEGITMRFGSKVPGTAMEIRDVNMDFAYGGSLHRGLARRPTSASSSTCCSASPPLFPRHEEVELSWRILDPVARRTGPADGQGKPEPYAAGGWGPAVGRRDAGPRRSRLEAAMTRLGGHRRQRTIAAAFVARPHPRRQPGDGHGDDAGRRRRRGRRRRGDGGRSPGSRAEHPSRVLGVILGDGRGRPRVDAEVGTGAGWSGELALIRLAGEVAKHPESVVLPLLLPDSPVVVWWPSDAPERPGDRPGRQARPNAGSPTAAAARTAAEPPRCSPSARRTPPATPTWPGPGSRRGARCWPPPWTSTPARITGAKVTAERVSPSADLLAAWLCGPAQGRRRPQPSSDGPGITEVVLQTKDGDIRITRPDGRLATFSSPGQPDRPVALQRRDVPELLAEELRRLDADDVYACRRQADDHEPPAEEEGHPRRPSVRTSSTARGRWPRPPPRRSLDLVADVQAAGRVPHIVLTGGTIADADPYRGGRATRPTPASTGSRWSSGGATSGSCPPTTPSATRARPGEAFARRSRSTATRVHEVPASDEVATIVESAATAYAEELRAAGAVRVRRR